MVHICLQKFETKCGPLIDPTVDHLLALLLWPKNTKKNNAQNWLKPLICSVFRETHLIKKNKNPIILNIANLTAPFDLDRKLFLFLASPFFQFFVPASSLSNTLEQKQNQEQKTTKTTKNNNHNRNNRNNYYRNNNNKNTNNNLITTTTTEQQPNKKKGKWNKKKKRKKKKKTKRQRKIKT